MPKNSASKSLKLSADDIQRIKDGMFPHAMHPMCWTGVHAGVRELLVASGKKDLVALWDAAV